MQVIINGEQTTLADVRTVANLLEQLELNGRVAVEINRQIVPGSEFDSHPVHDGDIIEIVRAIGGGCYPLADI